MLDYTMKEFYYIDPARSKTDLGKLMIENNNRKIDNISLMMEYGDLRSLCKEVKFTEHSLKSKMAHKHSLSTSVRLNRFCQARQCLKCTADGKEPVCPYCFANAINNARPTVDYAMTRNSFILWNVEIPSEVWRETREKEILGWDEPDARIQSLGDAFNVTEVRSYIHLEYAFPEIFWTPWSKNDHLWYQGFEALGKPENSNYIHSSLFINHIDEGPVWMQKYIDYIFTVFTEEYAKAHPEIVMNCCTIENKGRQCRRDCNDCYRKGACRYRNELIRGYKNGRRKNK